MFVPKGLSEKRDGGGSNKSGLVAVAIDKDKGSQYALKWAIDNLLERGQTVILINVKLNQNPPFSPTSPRRNQNLIAKEDYRSRGDDLQTKELFLPFRCFCTRKDIQCKDVIIEDVDVAKGLAECVNQAAIEHLVIGASAKGGFLRRFKEKDIPGTASRLAPDFCSVYVISKGKITSMRSASRAAPSFSSLRNQIMNQPSIKQADTKTSEPYVLPAADTPTPMPTPTPTAPTPTPPTLKSAERAQMEPIRNIADEMGTMRSPLTIGRGYMGKSYEKLPDTDISFVSTGRASVDRLFNSVYDNTEVVRSPGFSNSSGSDAFSSETSQVGRKSLEINSPTEYSVIDQDEEISMSSMGDMEAEMRRLKQELRQTIDMYSTACKEALTAKQKARELQQWKVDEQRKLEEARMAEEAALAVADREKAKSRAAIEAAEAAQRIAELEAQKRIKAEMKALKASEEKRKALNALSQTDIRYRKYTIEEIESATDFFAEKRKIGEGGYGPVYKCNLDHTPVAVKVLRPDAAQGRSQFQQEVEVLSCIRHPNMVLLLGACPEYGCLVYEYMGNGSLDDCLFRRGSNPPLSWQLRFKIAAEIATGLLFLHQTKPEPLVHRDLKPGNILLDRNYVSKISDVGLARLVPPTVADTVTQYRMTSTAGTFCYIDPEYQQTGMLGIKSDIYSLGIMLLQLITAKPPMGLTHHIDRAIENGTLADLLDPSVNDWPAEEALIFAKMALKCAELRRKDRPDLGKDVLPELNRLRALAEDEMNHGSGGCYSPQRQVSIRQDDYQQSEASSRGPSLIESSEVNY